MERRDFLRICGACATGLALDLLIPENLCAPADRRNGKRIIYTFDDVPFEIGRTKRLSGILKEYGCKSQFYLTGDGINYFPESVDHLISEGFTVGWHSMHHESTRGKSEAELKKDIREWKNVLKGVSTSYEPEYARFPYGKGTRDQIRILNEEGLRIQPCATRGIHPCNWDVDSMDWNPARYNPEETIDQIKELDRDYAVLLFHLSFAKPYLHKGRKVYESLATGDPEKFKDFVEKVRMIS